MKRLVIEFLVIGVLCFLYAVSTPRAGMVFYDRRATCVPVSLLIIDDWSTADIREKEQVMRCMAEVILRNERWR